MFNLYEILQNAQGGQAIENLAAQFGLTAKETEAAIEALVPALSEGLLKQASAPQGFGAFVNTLDESQHRAAFADKAVAQDSATVQKGNDILGDVLGSHEAQQAVVLRASSAAGVAPDILSQMLPVLVSMIFGGIGKSLQDQGLGGILGQFANASAGHGGLGQILGQILGGRPGVSPSSPNQPGGSIDIGSVLGQILGGGQGPSGPGPSSPAGGPPGAGSLGGLGGLLGSILGKLGSRPGPSAGPAPAGPAQQSGLDPSSIQAGLEALNKILRSGIPPRTGAPQGGIESEISDIMTGKHP
ncbi:MAG: DUF937 domain-containing protein [Alphaproteobacteria bacterium]|nr:DUF937 domain-containing protein [Alphaproteobacteria bacterium]